MNFQLLPINETIQILKTESDCEVAIEKIISCAQKALKSEIWKEYKALDIKRDIKEATTWIQDSIDKFPDSTGIYLGLDTLNMDNGNGTNIEIGLSKSCTPAELYDDWAYECENYGQSHLIKGLYDVAHTFDSFEKWTKEESNFAEYIIFLGYSGVILREALNNLKTNNDFLSIWGFHDGDMFLLTQKNKDSRLIVVDFEL